MARLLLRKTSSAAAVSPEDAAQLVCATGCGQVLHRDGNNLLVDVDGADGAALDALRAQLDGWIVSEQGARIAVPDTRVRLKT